MGYLNIIRPMNCMITFVSVLVGAWIGKGIIFPPKLILAGMIGFAICGFGNIINDLYDIEIDKINNPDRPLPSGKVNKKFVKLLAFFLFIISALFSISLGLFPLLLVITVSILLFIYASRLKKTIVANFVVSLITGLSFILGGIVVKNPSCIFPFLFSLFIHMPREIIKDIIDIEGDRTHGVISLPICVGQQRSFIICSLLLVVLCILLPLPYIMNILHIRYIIIVLLGAYPILLFCLFKFLTKPPQKDLKKYSNLLKISMAVGLIAMVL